MTQALQIDREAAGVSRRPSGLAHMRRRMFWPFVAPATVVFGAFFLFPTLAVAWISLNEWSGVGPMSWRGLRNYTSLVGDPTFQTAFWNSLKILFLAGAAVFVLSFMLTAALREMRGRKFARAVIFFPVIVSGIVVALVWGLLLQFDGTVNTALGEVGVEPIKFLGSEHIFTTICVGIVWINVGLFTTIILSGVDRIPPHLYEDADLIGCNAWQRFRHVTLPLSADVVSVAATLWTIESIKIFEFIFAFGGTSVGMPPTDIWNSALFVYGQSFGSSAFRFGYASAAALAMLVVFGLFVTIVRALTRGDTIEY